MYCFWFRVSGGDLRLNLISLVIRKALGQDKAYLNTYIHACLPTYMALHYITCMHACMHVQMQSTSSALAYNRTKEGKSNCVFLVSTRKGTLLVVLQPSHLWSETADGIDPRWRRPLLDSWFHHHITDLRLCAAEKNSQNWKKLKKACRNTPALG